MNSDDMGISLKFGSAGDEAEGDGQREQESQACAAEHDHLGRAATKGWAGNWTAAGFSNGHGAPLGALKSIQLIEIVDCVLTSARGGSFLVAATLEKIIRSEASLRFLCAKSCS
jgi:hypothetical protein